MSGRKIYHLFLAFLYCFMLLIYAWIRNSQLILSYKRAALPVAPWLLLGIIILAFVLTAMRSKAGMMICTILLFFMSLAGLNCHLKNHPLDPLQWHVVISLVVICVYGWIQIAEWKQ